MKKSKIIFGLLLVAGVALSGAWLYYKKMERSEAERDNMIAVGKCDFTIEAVSDEEQRKKGLSGRESLCSNCGMLFLFEKEDNYSFWMKVMRFPIDIIWVKDDEVVDINQNIDYNSKSIYSPREKINKVLELNANDVSRCEIKIGNKLTQKNVD